MGRILPFVSCFGVFVAMYGCGADHSGGAALDSTDSLESTTESASTGDRPTESGSATGDVLPPPTSCAEVTDVRAAPATIAEAVDFINALPRPVTLECFLEQLERPLALTATISTVSLQPAAGSQSPRVFLFIEDLILSVAVDGAGRELLEFGEIVAPKRSVKAELEFPIEDELTIADATTQVLDLERDDMATKCRFCHGFEDPSDLYESAFVSDALRFREDELIEAIEVEELQLDCDAELEPERCARLDALFAFGVVVEGDFPADLQTIYDY